MHPAEALESATHCFSSLLLLTAEDASCVHPDDLSAVRARYPGGWQLLCFRYRGRDGEHHFLDDGKLRARGRGAVIHPIPAPRYQQGDVVFARPKRSIGVVRQAVWHLNRACVYYLLEFDGRQSGRWYFESDLALPAET